MKEKGSLGSGQRAGGEENQNSQNDCFDSNIKSDLSQHPAGSPEPATAAQIAYLGKLLTRHGKPAYLAAKEEAGIPAETTLLKLSKSQAARVIRTLITKKGGRA